MIKDEGLRALLLIVAMFVTVLLVMLFFVHIEATDAQNIAPISYMASTHIQLDSLAKIMTTSYCGAAVGNGEAVALTQCFLSMAPRHCADVHIAFSWDYNLDEATEKQNLEACLEWLLRDMPEGTFADEETFESSPDV